MYHILIVDDKEIFQRTIRRMRFFTEYGDKFKIVGSAKNGLEALEYLRHNHVDITLTDIRMPVMDGISLLKKIQSEDLCKCTILLSEYSDFKYAKQGLINGAFDYLLKPVDDQILYETFQRAAKHLQILNTENTKLSADITKISKGILSYTDIQFEDSMETLFSDIQAALHSTQPKYASVDDISSSFQANIRMYHPYIHLYLPMERIFCSEDLMPAEINPMRRPELSLRFFRHETTMFRISSKHPTIQKLLHETLNHIEDNYRLQDFAEEHHINKNYLSTLFKKETGIYYKDLHQCYKISRAKILLTQTDLKIITIANQLNFADSDYFSSIFKKLTGTTPRKFSWDTEIKAYYARTSALLKKQ